MDDLPFCWGAAGALLSHCGPGAAQAPLGRRCVAPAPPARSFGVARAPLRCRPHAGRAMLGRAAGILRGTPAEYREGSQEKRLCSKMTVGLWGEQRARHTPKEQPVPHHYKLDRLARPGAARQPRGALCPGGRLREDIPQEVDRRGGGGGAPRSGPKPGRSIIQPAAVAIDVGWSAHSRYPRPLCEELSLVAPRARGCRGRRSGRSALSDVGAVRHASAWPAVCNEFRAHALWSLLVGWRSSAASLACSN